MKNHYTTHMKLFNSYDRKTTYRHEPLLLLKYIFKSNAQHIENTKKRDETDAQQPAGKTGHFPARAIFPQSARVPNYDRRP